MRLVTLIVAFFLLAGCKNSGGLSQWAQVGQAAATAAGYGPQAQQIGAVKDVLTSSTKVATNVMGQNGSYNIPLPDQLQTLSGTLSAFGYGDLLGNLKQRMNNAASAAAAEAAPVFKDAIRDITIPDAIGLVTGGQTSVTQYFRQHTESKLAAKMNPIVENKLNATGFNDEYQTFLNVYNTLPLTDKPNLDIKSYVVDYTLDGIYNKMAQEEVAIRKNPIQAGSKLVTQFFSGK